jgi:hypothetical protein
VPFYRRATLCRGVTVDDRQDVGNRWRIAG